MRKPRCAALKALSHMNAESYILAIVEHLLDTDWEVRVAAVDALGAMPTASKQYADGVADLLDDDTYHVRAAACCTLRALAAEDQADRLADSCGDPAQAVRAEAARALGCLGAVGSRYAREVATLTQDVSS